MKLEDTSRLDESFIKAIMKKVRKNTSLNFIFNTHEIYAKPKTT